MRAASRQHETCRPALWGWACWAAGLRARLWVGLWGERAERLAQGAPWVGPVGWACWAAGSGRAAGPGRGGERA